MFVPYILQTLRDHTIALLVFTFSDTVYGIEARGSLQPPLFRATSDTLSKDGKLVMFFYSLLDMQKVKNK